MSEPTIDLTDAEKRDLIALLQAGRPLPDKYRFLLFEDKREVELVWNGKTRDVCTTVLPFQTLEHVDEPRAEAASSPQAELFDARLYERRQLFVEQNPVWPERGETVEWEEVETGGYIFENERQSFRTRQDRALELNTARHAYTRAGRYQVAVKVIDIFGNDTMTLLPVNVG